MKNAQPYIFFLCVNANVTTKVQPTCFFLCVDVNIMENSFSASIPVENLAEALFCWPKTVHILPFQSKA